MGRIKRRITVSGDSLYVANAPSEAERVGTERGVARDVLGDVPRKSYTVVYTEAPKRGQFRVSNRLVRPLRGREYLLVCFIPMYWRGRINRRVIR